MATPTTNNHNLRFKFSILFSPQIGAYILCREEFIDPQPGSTKGSFIDILFLNRSFRTVLRCYKGLIKYLADKNAYSIYQTSATIGTIYTIIDCHILYDNYWSASK